MKIDMGIPNLNKLTSDGVPRGNMILISGDYGTGKTIFSLQFLAKGVKEWGEPGIFISFIDGRKTLLRDAKTFNWQLKRFENESNIKILGGYPERLEGFSEKAAINGEKLIEEIIKKAKEAEAERMAIDGLKQFSNKFKDDKTFKAGIAKLRNALAEQNCTTILTSKPDFGIEEIVDGVIILHYEGQLEKTRAIEIRKMRRTEHTDRVCPFEI
ncbi:hypothetical protein AKJ49_02165 [candidate division MSBL1 archaeon SCGC-AAA382A03]|uniref:KaiC domain-containing protein n=1 Tax=candidate division MSBL1 archaeon SCGC-AAA382A03 TaxID=1698278 RepID=A0A133VD55_9EURY|nr:hypothetical protein AKJ49_02165 [candidate division MSBL1 archaeon SCGC-AAA382A03]